MTPFPRRLWYPSFAMAEVTGIDHVYITVSELARSETFYDLVLRDTLGFRKNAFTLAGAPHIQYYNRHFGYVLRPARVTDTPHDPYAPGLHHFCLRVDSIAEVHAVATQLRASGIDATEATLYPQYASDYTATYFIDPDGIRLEVTNYRQERRERHDHWDALTRPAEPAADTASTVLSRMTPAAYAVYLQQAIAAYAEDNVAAGRWPAEGALARSQADFDSLLPQGLATPDHHLFDLRAGADGPVVGFLWFGIDASRGLRSAFVYDLGIHAPRRRQGHATRAFAALEALVQALGLDRIGLHVFGFNAEAQALYAKLGYGVTGLNLQKHLVSAAPADGTP
jgi:glyoxylase I family protein